MYSLDKNEKLTHAIKVLNEQGQVNISKQLIQDKISECRSYKDIEEKIFTWILEIEKEKFKQPQPIVESTLIDQFSKFAYEHQVGLVITGTILFTLGVILTYTVLIANSSIASADQLDIVTTNAEAMVNVMQSLSDTENRLLQVSSNTFIRRKFTSFNHDNTFNT